MNEIIHGDCLEVMKTFPDNHFSAIVTDPPYGLSFMNKGWDHVVPEVSYWKEALRISKPGSFLISMGGTRTFHRLTCAIEDAGWEIRDCISWLYGSGFPKSHNHFGIDGFGTALKPAWEPCIVAMKSLDGTFKQNAEKWGQAGINIDGCRVGLEEICAHGGGVNINRKYGMGKGIPSIQSGSNPHKGRWPANVILDEEAGAMLDEQSGSSTRKPDYRTNEIYNSIYQRGFKRSPNYISDSGGASRFFYCAKASPSERNQGISPLENELTGESVRDGGIRRGNNHPTVKPLKFMEYLIKLVMPPKDGLLLDPFAGSGTTILAAKRLGVDAIGIEKDADYVDIAKARVNNWQEIDECDLLSLIKEHIENQNAKDPLDD